MLRTLSVIAPVAIAISVLEISKIFGADDIGANRLSYASGMVTGFFALVIPGLATEEGVDILGSIAGAVIWFVGVPIAASTD